LQAECQEAEEFGFRATRRQRNADAARSFDNTARDFQQKKTNAGEFALSQRMPGWYLIAHIQQQPVGGGMQDQSELIGEG
jgi:hypothetical protein